MSTAFPRHTPLSFQFFAEFFGDLSGRGPGEASLRRRRVPARLLVAVAALVTCTIWLWSSSTDLTLTSYKAQVRSLDRACLPVCSLAVLFDLLGYFYGNGSTRYACAVCGPTGDATAALVR